MKAFKVMRVYCAGCSTERRVRIAIDEEGHYGPATPCPGCGAVAWSEDRPERTQPVHVAGDEPDGGGYDIFASVLDVREFWKHVSDEQNEYLSRRFAEWQAERNAVAQASRDAEEADRAAMFRQVWSILESHE